MKQLLCLGDSITDCNRSFSSCPLGNGYVHILAEQLGKNWEVVNRGVDGFTVQRVYEQTEREFGRFHPDIITILVGINDVCMMETTNRLPHQKKEMTEQFEMVYRKLIRFLKRYAPEHIILMEPFLFPEPAEYLNWYPQVKELSLRIRKLAEEYSLHYLSLWEPLLKFAKETGTSQVTIDGIHLTSKGHQFLAQQVLDCLDQIK